jgi:hypothetical protein
MCTSAIGTIINPVGKITGEKDPVSLIGKSVGGTTGQLIAPGLALRDPDAFFSKQQQQAANDKKRVRSLLAEQEQGNSLV